MTSVVTYGSTDVTLEDVIGSSQSSKGSLTYDGSALLWEYKNESKIGGVPVAPDSCGLTVDSEDLLMSAFRPVTVPKSLMLWMSPEDTDSLKTYDEILEQAAKGEIFIQEELKQYDPAKAKFIVWIRYNITRYELHPRFNFLRQD